MITNYKLLRASTRKILRLIGIGTKLTVESFLFVGGQRSWVIDILQVYGNVILLVMCLYMQILSWGFNS